MKTTFWHTMIVWVIVVLSGNSLLAEKPSPIVSINSADQALAKAIAFTGFDELTLVSPEKTVTNAAIRDSMIPFLSDYIDGRAVWRIDFENVLLNIETVNPEPEPVKCVTVYIDSLTGTLLRAKFTLPGKDSSRVQESTSDEMTRHLTGFDERLHGFPDIVPTVTLLEAIRLDKFYPLLAKEIVVWYVEYSRDTLESRPAWMICMLGMPPITSNQFNMQMDRRFVVDAIEGRVLFGLFYGFDRDQEITGP